MSVKGTVYLYNDSGELKGKKQRVEVYFPSSSRPLKIIIKLPQKGLLNCEVEIPLKGLLAMVLNRMLDTTFKD